MGQRGPLKGSKHLRGLPGGKNGARDAPTAKPTAKRLTVPSFLPPEARKLLRKIIPELQETLAAEGGLKEADLPGLVALSLHYTMMILAVEQMKGPDGKFMITIGDPEHPTADGEEAIRKHPLLSVIANHSEKLKAWVSEYAMTPAARLRLNIKPPKGASKLEAFVAGKKY